jgi:hypothetical protein
LNGAAIVMPLMAIRPSLIGPPRAAKNVIVGDAASAPSLTFSPGTAFNRVPTERFPGIAATMSALSTVSFCALWTSTTGVSPVTVIVSSSAPTRMSIGIVSVVVPLSSMPSRLTRLKPVSLNVSVYVPGLRLVMRYWPASSVTPTRTFSMSAGLEASTVTPGNTPPGLVPDRTCEGTLREGKRRKECHRHQDQDRDRRSAHGVSFVKTE